MSTTAEHTAEQIDNARFKPAHVVMIGACMLLNLLDGFDVTAMAISKTAVAADLGLSAVQLGYLDGVALFGMCIGAMFLGALADVVGRRRTILTSVTVIALSMAVTSVVTSFEQFFLIRLVTGLGVGATLASVAATVSEFSPEKYKAFAVTLATVGYPTGAMIGGAIGPDLIASFGWSGLFLFGAAATGVAVVLAWFAIPESVSYLMRRQPQNALVRMNATLARFKLPQLDGLPELAPRKGGLSDALLGVYRNVGALLAPQYRVRTIMLWTTFFFCFIALYFLMSWVPYLIEDAGYTRAQGGQGFAALNTGAIIGVLLVAWISTRYSLSATVASFLLISAGVLALTSVVSVDFTLLLILVLAIGTFQQGGFTGLYACAAKAYPAEIQATGVGWSIGLGRVGAIVGPAAAGYMIEGGMGLQETFGWFALPMVVAGVFAFLLRIR